MEQQFPDQYSQQPQIQNQGFTTTISLENARFMSRVYGWMTAGLCLTGAVAWNVSGSPEMVQAIFGNRLLFWGLIIEIGRAHV